MQIQFIALDEENRYIKSETGLLLGDKFPIFPKSQDTQNGLQILYGVFVIHKLSPLGIVIISLCATKTAFL